MRKRQAGVTLMELLTVMVVVAILAAIAIPSYRRYVMRANRTDAKTAILAMAGELERCYTRFNTYADADTNCSLTLTGVSSSNGDYKVSASNLSATTFTITAVPQGGQAKDTQCGSFSLDQANERKVTGTLSADPGQCWAR